MTAEPINETGVPVLDIERLEQQVDELHAAYQQATPYPHIVLDDFLEPGVAELAIKEFPPLDPEQWNNYLHANERKFSNTDPETWGPTLRSILAELNSPRFVEFIGSLIGVEHLVPDPSLEGGGLHQSGTGGSSTSTPTSPCIPTTGSGNVGPTSCCTSTTTGSPSTAGTSNCGAPT